MFYVKKLRRAFQKSLTSEEIHEDFPISLKGDQLMKLNLLIIDLQRKLMQFLYRNDGERERVYIWKIFHQ